MENPRKPPEASRTTKAQSGAAPPKKSAPRVTQDRPGGPESGPRPQQRGQEKARLPTEAPRAGQDHLRRPVNFTSGLQSMWKKTYKVHAVRQLHKRPSIEHTAEHIHRQNMLTVNFAYEGYTTCLTFFIAATRQAMSIVCCIHVVYIHIGWHGRAESALKLLISEISRKETIPFPTE